MKSLEQKIKWGERKKKIFLWYVKIEHWRNIGASYVSTLYGWLSVNTLVQAFTLGGIAKLTILKDMPIMLMLGVVFILGIIAEVVKIYFGNKIWKSGLIKTQNEWMQKHNINNPFNEELKRQIIEIAKVVGAKVIFKNDEEYTK